MGAQTYTYARASTRDGDIQQIATARYGENIEQCFVVTIIIATFTEENLKQL